MSREPTFELCMQLIPKKLQLFQINSKRIMYKINSKQRCQLW